MKHVEGSYVGAGKLRIYFQSWLPDRVKSSVVIAHGLGEHGGRYAELAKVLVAAGHAVHAVDHRGHGQSEGPRAYVDRFSNAVDDLHQLVERARRPHPHKPLFLLGHSMGGALALSYTLRHGEQLSGLILSGPAVALDGAPPLMKPISKLLSFVAPKLGMFAIDPSLVSRDDSRVAAYRSDPLNAHGKVPARTLGEIVKFVEWFPAVLSFIKLPLLVLHGSDDKLAGVAGSRMVVDQVASNDKTLKVYEGLYHEIFNELPRDRERVINDLVDWLSAHSAA